MGLGRFLSGWGEEWSKAYIANTDDDYALGTRLSEAEDSGLPREFSHESCQMSGTAAGRHVVKDTALKCFVLLYPLFVINY